MPVLGQGARDSTTTFSLEGVGDVHLTWENEALRETKEAKGDLEIVYPPGEHSGRAKRHLGRCQCGAA